MTQTLFCLPFGQIYWYAALKEYKVFLILLIVCFYTGIAYSQANPQDSNQKKIIVSLPDSIQSRLNMSDTSLAVLVKRVEDVTKIISMANNILVRGFDTAKIVKELSAVEGLVNYYTVAVTNKKGEWLTTIRALRCWGNSIPSSPANR